MSTPRMSLKSTHQFSGGHIEVTLRLPADGPNNDRLLSVVNALVHTVMIPQVNTLPETDGDISSVGLTKLYRTSTGAKMKFGVRVRTDRPVDTSELLRVVEHTFTEVHVLTDMLDEPNTDGAQSLVGNYIEKLLGGLFDTLEDDGNPGDSPMFLLDFVENFGEPVGDFWKNPLFAKAQRRYPPTFGMNLTHRFSDLTGLGDPFAPFMSNGGSGRRSDSEGSDASGTGDTTTP